MRGESAYLQMWEMQNSNYYEEITFHVNGILYICESRVEWELIECGEKFLGKNLTKPKTAVPTTYVSLH